MHTSWLTFIVSRVRTIRTIGSVFIVDSDDILIDDGRGRDVGGIVMVMIMVIDLVYHFVYEFKWK
jgi:hypothetical protein